MTALIILLYLIFLCLIYLPNFTLFTLVLEISVTICLLDVVIDNNITCIIIYQIWNELFFREGMAFEMGMALCLPVVWHRGGVNRVLSVQVVSKLALLLLLE